MTSRHQIETGLWYPNHRAFPPVLLETYIRALEEAGVVDYIMLFDILAGWYPPPLWSDEFTNLTQELPDFNSFFDAFVTAGVAAARAARLGVWVGTNAVRHGPAELLQASTTLTAATNGRAIVSVGAGEAYNTVPYGYDRRSGIARVEDHFKLYDELWERESPFDYAGKAIRYDKRQSVPSGDNGLRCGRWEPARGCSASPPTMPTDGSVSHQGVWGGPSSTPSKFET